MDNQKIDYLFVPSNDTHVYWMSLIAKLLSNSDYLIIPERNENADKALEELGQSYKKYVPGIIRSLNPKVVILGIDWGIEELQIVVEARMLSIPTVTIQEGYSLASLKNGIAKYSYTDYFFSFGEIYLSVFNRDNTIITGNPKFDEIKKIDLPDTRRVMLNCNFTYGIEEELRNQWLTDVIESCQHLNLDYFVSQHPRDRAKLPENCHVVKSSAGLVSSQLKDCSIVISRASTLIYEAILSGRRVIYYNPKGAFYSIFEEDPNGVLLIAKNPEELVSRIQEALQTPRLPDDVLNAFIEKHLGNANHSSAGKCAKALSYIKDRDERLNELLHPQSKSYSHLSVFDTYRDSIRLQNNVILDLRKWIKDLVDSVDWHEQQLVNYQNSDKKLREWIDELQKGKTWLEEQLKNYQESDKELRKWNDELQEGKTWLEGQLKNYQESDKELRNWNGELQEGKTWLEAQIKNYQESEMELRSQLNTLKKTTNTTN